MPKRIFDWEGKLAEKTIAQKLFLKSGMRILLVGAPQGYLARLKLPKDVVVVKRAPADSVLGFLADSKEMRKQMPALRKAVAPNGMLWVSYLKGTSKIKTDINRDILHAYARTVGLEGVSLISLDDDWSAMRFKLV